MKEYGLDPTYKQPSPPPIVPTSTETAIMDEIDRIARAFSKELSREQLHRELGTIDSNAAGAEVSIKPRSALLASITARVGGSSYEEIAVHLVQPIKVEVLMTRYREFENHLTDTREEEFVDYDTDIYTSRRYRVSLAVRAGHLMPERLAKESVGVVYFHRYRR